MLASQATARRRVLANAQATAEKRPPLPVNTGKPMPANYFGAQAFVVLICLTASLLILPLILPPLQPPPILLLLLLPIGILALLLVLAFMPADVRGIASAYL